MDDFINSIIADCSRDTILTSQRPLWDSLKKTITGLVSKITVSNVRNVAEELLNENLIWGRGLFCSVVLKASKTSHALSPVFAALIAVINSRFPDVGYLLLKRMVNQIKIACKRNDKVRLMPLMKLLAHLINQGVVHEPLAVQTLFFILQNPTKDSVEVAVLFVQQCGSAVQGSTPRGLDAVFVRFREIIHEGEMDKRTESLIDDLFTLRRTRFLGYPSVCPELVIVELDDQVTHEISLFNNVMNSENHLDVFWPEPRFLMSDDDRYELLKSIVLKGENNEEDAECNQDESDQENTNEDETETELLNLRRTIFLTLMSGTDFEDAGNKLLNITLRANQEMEICNMLLECCSHQRTYNRYFTLVAQKLCLINKVYRQNFKTCFVQQYSSIHRLQTYKLHNVSRFFAHLLSSDSLKWHVLAYIHLTEEDTTSSSRIFIRILFQELSEELGVPLLIKRLNDPTIQRSLESIFPKDNSRNMRFCINFFTSIGLEGLIEDLREFLKKMQKQNQVSHPDEEIQSFGTSETKAASSASDMKSLLLDSQQNDPSNRHGKRRRTS